MEVYYMFKADNPIFYFASNTLAFYGTSVYYLTDEAYAAGAARASYQAQITQYIEGFAGCVSDASKFDTSRSIHDQLCSTLDYSYEEDGTTPDTSLSAHNIIGTMEGHGVCEAYTRAYQMLLNYYGISNLYVSGQANGEPHAWNLVELDDGNYYYIDCTLDDQTASYDYFAIGSSTLGNSHCINSPENTAGDFLYTLPAVSETDYFITEEHSVTQDGIIYTIYSNSTAAVSGYTGEPAIVTIPEAIEGAVVSAVNGGAFAGCSTLEEITLPYTLKSIKDSDDSGNGAFEDCSALRSVHIPENAYLSYIGTNAFSDCISLTDITLPDTTRVLALSCFECCASLTELTIPEGLTEIGQNALTRTGLKQLRLPASLTSLNTFFGGNMENLEFIEVAEGNPILRSYDGVLYYYGEWISADITFDGTVVPTDGGYGLCLMLYPIQKKDAEYTVVDETACIFEASLDDNAYLTSINIGNAQFSAEDFLCDVKLGEENPWYSEKDGLILNKEGDILIYVPKTDTGEFTVPDGIRVIGSCAFYKCSYNRIILPDGLESIGPLAFAYTDAASVVIPDSVSKIGDSAFSFCAHLKEVNIPEALTKIEWNTFLDCTALTEITIPETTDEIGLQAFADCTSLRSVTILNPECSIYDYENTFPENAVIVGMENSTAQRHAEKHNRAFGIYNENPALIAVTGSCGTDVTWSVSSDGILTIRGTGAMDDYTEEQPSPWNAYRNASPCVEWFRNIRQVIIEDGVTHIGNQAFIHLTHIMDAEISKTVTSIGDMAFYNTGLTEEPDLTSAIVHVGREAFHYTPWYEQICAQEPDAPVMIGSILYHAFSAATVSIPENTTYICEGAFDEVYADRVYMNRLAEDCTDFLDNLPDHTQFAKRIDLSGLVHIQSSAETDWLNAGENLEVTLTAEEGYYLPERINVTIDDEPLHGMYYDQETGFLSISSDDIPSGKNDAGVLKISAEATAAETTTTETTATEMTTTEATSTEATTTETTTTEATSTEATTETTTITPDLPQTGLSTSFRFILLAAAAMLFFGAYAVILSQKRITYIPARTPMLDTQKNKQKEHLRMLLFLSLPSGRRKTKTPLMSGF
ncbi:MAG: leucine-rich repeat protein [Oscillospiraceae bacterium]|nr:leucine-rich repeat protein [Oscillospiraceae bacterium]